MLRANSRIPQHSLGSLHAVHSLSWYTCMWSNSKCKHVHVANSNVCSMIWLSVKAMQMPQHSVAHSNACCSGKHMHATGSEKHASTRICACSKLQCVFHDRVHNRACNCCKPQNVHVANSNVCVPRMVLCWSVMVVTTYLSQCHSMAGCTFILVWFGSLFAVSVFVVRRWCMADCSVRAKHGSGQISLANHLENFKIP